MTTLDQAFIKAFSRQETPFAGALPRAAGIRPSFRVSEKETVPLDAGSVQAPMQISDVVQKVLKTLENPSGETAPPANDAREPQSELRPAVVAMESPSEPASFGNQESTIDFRASSTAPFVFSSLTLDSYFEEPANEEVSRVCEPFRPDELSTVEKSLRVVEESLRVVKEEEERSYAEGSSAGKGDSPIFADAKIGTVSVVEDEKFGPVLAVEERPFAVEAPALATPPFKPAWQVDQFTWPRACRRLMARAEEEFDRLADSLLAANAQGQKVLAVAGCSRGEGATTLLLCVARRLAERGVGLVLVDADLNRPRLAPRLGVQSQWGWNETSDAEGMTLDHAVVEAVSNNLTLAALREPEMRDGRAPGDWSQLAPCLETLRNHYEMTLVDLGPLENIAPLRDSLGRSLGEQIDGVLLVHNRRITSDERLAEIERELTASGVALVGLIENFVTA